MKVLNADSSLKNINPIELSSSSFEQSGLGHGSGDFRNFELPKIQLPTFDNGKEEYFRIFIVGFKAIINKHILSSYEKYLTKRVRKR